MFNTRKAIQNIYNNECYKKYNLVSEKVQWNDVERYSNSCWGSNISDWTLVLKNDENLLPLIKPQNFTDKVSVMSTDKIGLIVGNEKFGEELRAITLSEYLKNFDKYNSDCDRNTNLYSEEMDSKITIRAQAVPLPVDSKTGIIEFNPTSYSYQTVSNDDPRNVNVVSSHLGTSSQTDCSSKQNIFIQRTLPDQRKENVYFKAKAESSETDDEKSLTSTILGTKSMGCGRNRVIFIQIPIKQKVKHSRNNIYNNIYGSNIISKRSNNINLECCRSFENANIYHGTNAGYAKKLGRTDLVRDKNQHITITVCFYYAVPNGILTDENVKRIRDDLTSVYKDGFWTGSLVTNQQIVVEESEPPIKLTQEMKDFIHLNYPKYEYPLETQ